MYLTHHRPYPFDVTNDYVIEVRTDQICLLSGITDLTPFDPI